MKRIAAIFVLLLFGATAPGAARQCSVCGKTLRGKYLSDSEGHLYCGSRCADTRLPRCALCGKTLKGRYLLARERKFCSEECMRLALWPRCAVCGKPFQDGRKLPTPYGEIVFCTPCAELPPCFVCQTPVKAGRTLRDGRICCVRCGERPVGSIEQAQKIFRSVRAVLREKLHFPNGHAIELKFAALEPPRSTALGVEQEFGRYIYTGKEIYSTPPRLKFWKKQETTVRREETGCRIEVLKELPSVKLAEVLAHETAHDYMQRRWPYIRDEKLKEGFAEVIAAQYNRFTGQAAWNVRMENNPDPVYGDGYRMMRDLWNKGGWRAVQEHLDRANRANLPPELRQTAP